MQAQGRLPGIFFPQVPKTAKISESLPMKGINSVTTILRQSTNLQEIQDNLGMK